MSFLGISLIVRPFASCCMHMHGRRSLVYISAKEAFDKKLRKEAVKYREKFARKCERVKEAPHIQPQENWEIGQAILGDQNSGYQNM